MEELLREIVVRQCHSGGGYDSVFIVRNLPKSLLYHKVAPMVQKTDRDGNIDGTMIPDLNANKVWALFEGITYNEENDEFMFWTEFEGGIKALAAVDQYIEANIPREAIRPKRVMYSSQKGNMQANPIQRNRMPIIHLEAKETLNPAETPASPPTQVVVQETAGTIKKVRKPLTEEQKQAARERMARARAARK